MAKITCHVCKQDWDSAVEIVPAEWVEVGDGSWLPACPDCFDMCYPGVPKRAARSVPEYIVHQRALPPGKVEAPFKEDT